jgi:hypothetical protein
MTCQEAAQLISEGKDRRLTLGQHLGLRFHLLFCRLCTVYKHQLDLISTLSARAGELRMGDPRHGLSPEARDRMRGLLGRR